MAFRVFTCRLPEEYIAKIRDIAGEEDESQGYMVQTALHRMLDGALPPPRRRYRATMAPGKGDDKGAEKIAAPAQDKAGSGSFTEPKQDSNLKGTS